MTQLNAKAMNILSCLLDINEFNIISSCISAKQIWEKLKTIFEGANQEETSSSQEEKKAHPNIYLMAHEDGKKNKKKQRRKLQLRGSKAKKRKMKEKSKK
ncbi:hypothetical protein COCNU_scaffold008870G000020 [Cocos nucifera]|nr:hypothetical protein [Cocos nucifera]